MIENDPTHTSMHPGQLQTDASLTSVYATAIHATPHYIRLERLGLLNMLIYKENEVHEDK